jgi:hypothetical protein
VKASLSSYNVGPDIGSAWNLSIPAFLASIAYTIDLVLAILDQATPDPLHDWKAPMDTQAYCLQFPTKPGQHYLASGSCLSAMNCTKRLYTWKLGLGKDPWTQCLGPGWMPLGALTFQNPVKFKFQLPI